MLRYYMSFLTLNCALLDFATQQSSHYADLRNLSNVDVNMVLITPKRNNAVFLCFIRGFWRSSVPIAHTLVENHSRVISRYITSL